MKILILEDSEERQKLFTQWLKKHEVTFTTTVPECIKLLEEHTWNALFLDHDLGGEEMVESGPGTGYEVAQWLVEHPDKVPLGQIVVHSLNPCGRNNIFQALVNKFGNPDYVVTAPGCWLKGKS